jgi:hypothetical protein
MADRKLITRQALRPNDRTQTLTLVLLDSQSIKPRSRRTPLARRVPPLVGQAVRQRSMTDFVPEEFTPPDGLVAAAFVLEPLGPEHNDADHAAWMSSIEHIHATAGFGDDPDLWPRPMTLEQNLSDLEQHAQDFRNRVGFTYTVLDPVDRDVIGCVYLYPSPLDRVDVRARSWVRRTHADLDEPLRRAVRAWLDGLDWPFQRIDFAAD